MLDTVRLASIPLPSTATRATRRTRRWRVAVDLEFEVAGRDRDLAIARAESLLNNAMPGDRLPDGTRVEVVMSLPVPLSPG
ncbi:MAG: hypothetical protein J2P45_03835 [Candidatus Dormibacteraeota bacterium]|nr:hypothetical protein [Candidatus Dormibacteraeota bacterium]